MNTHLLQKRKLQEGAIPLFLLVLIFLVLVGGGGYALVQLASPECQDLSIDVCLFNPAKKMLRQEKEDIRREEAVKQGLPAKESEVKKAQYSAEQKKWTGEGTLRFNFTKLDSSEQTLALNFDGGGMGGEISLTNQGVSTGIFISGSVNAVSGVINGALEGESTQKVSQGPIQGSVTTSYSGQFTGNINEDGSAAGTMVLVQKVVGVEGKVGLSVGKTDTITLPWTGNVEKDY